MGAASVTVPAQATGAVLDAMLREPAAALAAGGLVAFPTETVYGLGADATSSVAVERIFLAKGRPADNPLIVHLADADWIARVAATVTPLATALADAAWPGPLTLVLDARDDVPRATTGGLCTVAVRVPANPLARRLIDLAGTPVAAPSANLSGRPSPTTAAHVLADLGARLDWVVDGGPCPVGIESTVVDARGSVPVVLRDGAVTREALIDLAGRVETPREGLERGGAVRSPGTRHAHYQPAARVVIAPVGHGPDVAADIARRGSVGLVGDHLGSLPPNVVSLGTPVGAAELAGALYACLRQADVLGLPTVVVEAVADEGLGRAVMDRLRRAADQPG